MEDILSQESRRKLLKGLALALPAAWTTPVVESIVLPAHAQTSPACDAPPGCYDIPEFAQSFDWPGGAGPETVDVFEELGCEGDPFVTQPQIVVADSLEAAQNALGCEGGLVAQEFETDPPLAGGCSFFACVGGI
jgi:hypothetical protein